MNSKRKPKVIIVLLTGGTLALIGGGAVAASLPGPDHTMQMMALAQARQSAAAQVAAPASPAAGSTAAAAPAAAPASTAAAVSTVDPPAPAVAASAPPTSSTAVSASTVPAKVASTPLTSKPRAAITYVVKPGDTLSGIAEWFQLHGYGDLYAANAAMIGANPNLIRPGERITVGDGIATMTSPA